jgi:transposase
MRQIKEILRLKHQHQLSVREIARSCGLPPSTVNDYLLRAQATGLSWPLPEGMDDQHIQERLLHPPQAQPRACPPAEPPRPLPDWPEVHQELGRRSVTLRLLWQEYRQRFPKGYGYTQFCEYYHRWAETLDPVMRHHHPPGEKMFVDWAGQTVPIQAADGVSSPASVFIAVLGASNKTFAEAFANQKLPSWITAHCAAYNFFHGVTRVTVPDYVARNIIGILFPPAICAQS